MFTTLGIIKLVESLLRIKVILEGTAGMRNEIVTILAESTINNVCTVQHLQYQTGVDFVSML